MDGAPIGQPMRYESWVRAVAFSPDGGTVLVTTYWWLHILNVEDGSQSVQLIPILNCMLPGSNLATGVNNFHFLDPSGHQIQIAVRPTVDSVQVIPLRLDRADVTPIVGDPNQLLDEWQRRLGLRINGADEIVPY